MLFADTGNSKGMPCQPARNGYRGMEGDSSMRLITGLALISILPGLTACGPIGPGPITGGPCSYETSIVEGTVMEVDEDGALFIGGKRGSSGCRALILASYRTWVTR
jgi:hypothetical protein